VQSEQRHFDDDPSLITATSFFVCLFVCFVFVANQRTANTYSLGSELAKICAA
jgi:hypothetical protein